MRRQTCYYSAVRHHRIAQAERRAETAISFGPSTSGSTHHTNNTRQGHDPNIAPPLLSPDRSGSSSESVRLSRERVRLVHEQIQALSSLQDRVNVLDHDIFAVYQPGPFDISAASRFGKARQTAGIASRCAVVNSHIV
jgi:hypothetical protein